MCMIEIRKARETDLDQILDGIRQFLSDLHTENNGLFFDRTKATPFYQAAITSDMVEMLVADDNGTIAAALTVLVSPWYLGNPGLMIAEELGFYVRSDYRGNARLGIRLYLEMEKRLKERGVSASYMSSMAAMENVERVDRFYRRLGFEIEQVKYVKPLWSGPCL